MSTKSSIRVSLNLVVVLLILATAATPSRAWFAITSTNNNRKLTANSQPQFTRVIAFGDSATDTGNAVRTSSHFEAAGEAPYGDTFFKKATGRWSDGRLMLDYLLQSLDIPLLQPHLGSDEAHQGSENFAVAGATALDGDELKEWVGTASVTPQSLSQQLAWFKSDVADNKKSDVGATLAYFGEIGVNDYNAGLAAGSDANNVTDVLVPRVVGRVADALEDVLAAGVRHVVVQGLLPMGCMAAYLGIYSADVHDAHECVAGINELSHVHNGLLKEAIEVAGQKYPEAKVVYFDTQDAYLHIIENKEEFGFSNVKEPCLQGGAPTLALLSVDDDNNEDQHGNCKDPSKFVSWDGIHLTDAMNGAMVKLFLSNSKFASPFPNFLTTMSSNQS